MELPLVQLLEGHSRQMYTTQHKVWFTMLLQMPEGPALMIRLI